MPTAVAGPEIERLIQLLARLPGLGPRSARRAALHLIKKREALMTPLAGALQVILAHALRTEDPSQSEEHREPVDRAVHQGATQLPPGAAAATAASNLTS